MSAVSPIARPSVGRTFIMAISVVGCIALAQIGAVGWVFVKRFTSLTERAKLGPVQKLTIAATPVAGDLATNATLDARDPFEEVRKTTVTTEPIPPPPKPVPVSSAKLNPQAPPETRYQELVQQGKQLRDRGDTGAALVKLREALALEPQNPEAMAETAVTYERMSLMDKAAEQWKRIFDMGDAAGTYYIAAESRMKMSQAQALAATQMAQAAAAPKEGALSKLRADALLGIGEIARQTKPESGGTRFALRVPIKAKPSEAVSVADVDIHVLFYDLVDGKAPVQTSADVSYRWASAPIDWSHGDAETLEVEYSQQPPLAKGPKTEKREYYGYIVRVYYKSELQDLRAEPEALNAKFPAPQTLDPTSSSKK
jgi:tetratricopeptide (TPR) repeat protein